MQAASQPPVIIDVLLPRTLAQSRMGLWAMDFALMFGFAWFVALSAQIAVRLPWTTVPITLQTFAVLVTGGVLGARRGAGSLALYMLMGILAVPVFAPSSSAFGLQGDWGFHFLFPWIGTAADPWNLSSGGYIVGFILAAYLAGLFAEKGWDRKAWNSAGMILANAVVYVPGLLWLFYLIATDWVPSGASQPIGEFIPGGSVFDKTLRGGLYPFIVGDLMKLYLASLTLPAVWALVNRFKNKSQD